MARAAALPRVIFIREFVRFPPAAPVVSLKDLPAASAGARFSDSMHARRGTSAGFIVIASRPVFWFASLSRNRPFQRNLLP
jgi:hypothetical protein